MRISAFVFVVVLLISISAEISAQSRSGYERYLNGLDKNGNGRIDTDEMSGRSREWFRGLGLDTSRSIRISDIVRMQERKSSADRRKRERDKADKNFSNNVPGFSAAPPEAEKIQGFGFTNSNLVDNGKGITVGRKQYSSSVIRQADDTLRRYDRNKDGVLDRNELERGRWSNPPWTDSDTNKDRRLTRDELLERYKRRESNWSSAQKLANKSLNRSRVSNWRSKSSPTTSSYKYSTNKSKYGSSSTSSSDSSSYYPKYVRGIIDKYDKDKDGKLSSSELKKMSRAPRNADTDKDGKLSYEEMLAYYTKGSKSGSSSSRSGSRFGSRNNNYGSTVSFSRNDKNQDGQIAMHEYTKEWTDELLDEFNRIDQNGDGFISKHEFDASKNKSSSSSSSNSSSSRRSRFSRNR